MRRVGVEVWSGLAMLVVSVAVGGPVLFGVAEPTIARGWWIALFAAHIAVLLVTAVGDRPSTFRHVAFAAAVGSCWAVVLTAPNLGLLSILLVLVAALSVYVAPVYVAFVVVGLNTGVLALVAVQRGGGVAETTTTLGFYLLIQLAVVLSSVAFVREQRMRRELTEAHVDLRATAVLLSESTRTAERLRISRDLHDLIGHQLTVLTLELEAARHREPEQARTHVDRANRVARDLLADVRATVGELRTEPSDLTEALRQVVQDLPGLEVSIDVDADVRVGEEQIAAFVRAVQELVTNAIRHADARELWIQVSSDGPSAILTAVDDGRGAREPVLGNGLRGLVERFEALGGAVAFDGSGGFRVTARVPVS